MSLARANPANSSEEPIYEIASKLLNKALEKIVERLFETNGIPLPFSVAHKKLVSFYGQKMLELYKTTSKYDPYWWQISNLTKNISEDAASIFGYIKTTPVISFDRPGPAILFEALLYPHAASQYSEQQIELRRKAEELVDKFDCILNAEEEILAFLGAFLKRHEKFLQDDVPRNNMDLVLGHAALSRSGDSLCSSAGELFDAYVKLTQHRNEWGEFLRLKNRSTKTFQELSSLCPLWSR